MSFARRLIDITIQLASGTFTESGTDTVTLSGLRVSTRITKAGGASMGMSQISIYGMTLSMMNQLSTLGMKLQIIPKNTIIVKAGDSSSSMAIVFYGSIASAYADFQAAPQNVFQIQAFVLAPQASIPAVATSFNGPADVPTMMEGFAKAMGLTFENSGVTSQLSYPYYSGSIRNQALQCVQDAQIAWNGGDNGVLAIWPKNGVRGGSNTPVVSAETGMVGYPTYSDYGLLIKSLFNPSIVYGAMIKIITIIKIDIVEEWAVYSLDYELDSQVPNGSWFMTIGAYNPKYPAPPV